MRTSNLHYKIDFKDKEAEVERIVQDRRLFYDIILKLWIPEENLSCLQRLGRATGQSATLKYRAALKFKENKRLLQKQVLTRTYEISSTYSGDNGKPCCATRSRNRRRVLAAASFTHRRGHCTQ